MKSFLAVVGLLAFVGGLFALFAAKSAIHEILGGVGVLTGVVAVGLSHIISNLEAAAQRAEEIDRRRRGFEIAVTNFLTDARVSPEP
jgi:uncharacterized membrane protein